MQTSLIELNLACDDVIFSPSDNFLSMRLETFLSQPIRKLIFRVNKADPHKEEAKCLTTNQVAGIRICCR